MEIRKGESAPETSPDVAPITSRYLCFLSSLFLLPFFLIGCAAPSEPYERKPPAPSAITDLAAAQSGNGVILTFTLPDETLDHRPLAHEPAFEVYRDFEPNPAGAVHVAVPPHPTLVATIPEAMAAGYSIQGHVTYTDALHSGEFAQHPDSTVVYMVRTSMSPNKESPDSNPASLKVFPVPDPIDDLKAEVTQSAVVLTWSTPQDSVAGATLPVIGYHIYRTEVLPPSTATKPKSTASAAALRTEENGAAAPSTRIGDAESASTSFDDRQFEFGKTYIYSVRSIVQYPGESLESSDSNLTTVTPKDTFPPAAPQGLVATLVPGQGQTHANIDLSWAISPETDIAGYYVYRSDQAGVPGTRLNTELLLTPAFRDMNVLPDHRYFYSVTAVDSSGNESSPGTAVSGEMPAESQPRQ